MFSRITALTLSLSLVLYSGCQPGKTVTESHPPAERTATILVATRPLPSWCPIKLGKGIEWQEWDWKDVPTDAVHFFDSYFVDYTSGDYHPKYPIYPGPVPGSKLQLRGSNFTGKVRNAMQVYSLKTIPSDPIFASLSPSSLVDLEVLLTDRRTDERSLRCFLRNALVFQVKHDPNGSVVQLLVRPHDSEKILLAQQLGDVRLVPSVRPSATEIAKASASPTEPAVAQPTLTQTISARTHPRAD